jgi:type VI secretion system protein ImpC
LHVDITNEPAADETRRPTRFRRLAEDDDRQSTVDLIDASLEDLDLASVDLRDIEKTVSARVTAIDELLSAQLTEIVHAPDFRALEARWRGLHLLVSAFSPDDGVRVRIFTATKREIHDSFRNIDGMILSSLQNHICDFEQGSWGGDSFDLIIGDYEFGPMSRDIETLDMLAAIAMSAKAPFLSGMSPGLIGLERIDEISDSIHGGDVGRNRRNPVFAKWNSFREQPHADFAILTMPRVLLRCPHRPDSKGDNSVFTETVELIDSLCWANASWALALVFARAFTGRPLCSDSVRGPGGAGLIDGLAAFEQGSAGQSRWIGPTECPVSESVCERMAELGITALVPRARSNEAAAFHPRSCRSEEIAGRKGPWMSRPATPPEHIVALSRLCHYVMALVRSSMGAFPVLADFEALLNARLEQAAAKLAPGLVARRVVVEPRVRLDRTSEGTLHVSVHATLREAGLRVKTFELESSFSLPYEV